MNKFAFISCLISLISGSQGLIATSNDFYEYTQTCAELFKPEIIQNGCNGYMKELVELMKKCKNNLNEPWTCQDSKCLLSLRINLLSEDSNEIDEKKVEEILKSRANDSEVNTIFHRIFNLCLDRKYNLYMQFAKCWPMNYQICVNAIYFVEFMQTSEWDDTTKCSDIRETANKCQTILEKLEKK